ncbi:hypothetical protein [Aurantimonas coralicida]|uniref:hypothetical protein n=1 Tax=Aurantimonas coralicida TaxID=182270 RepID=UPI001D18AD0F|nr:hypothetical protein [Aurantimonas coralicida]MCC4300180.1 hypothetical protein [Aurantimonas coralicida]
MADALVARTTASCKENSNNNDGTPSHFDGPAADTLPPIAFGPTRPRGFAIGGSLYVAGLAPAVRIDDIPDLPDDLKAQMKRAAKRRAALALDNESNASAVRETKQENPSLSGLSDSVASEAVPSGLVGPVFCRTEISASRALIERLNTRRFVLVRREGLCIAPDVTVNRDLCLKLAAIGMVSVAEWRGRLVVRRQSGNRPHFPRG